MWLRKELQTICLKEFTIRHQLDLLQDNAYIDFNVRHLSALLFDQDSKIQNWSHTAALCDKYWLNFVGYLQLFPDVHAILIQKEFISVHPPHIREDNCLSVLKHRIRTCDTFLEICRSIAYQGLLRDHVARSSDSRELFHILSERSRYTDPAGHRLLALNNRINFIRKWLDKLIYRHQALFLSTPIKRDSNKQPNHKEPYNHSEEFKAVSLHKIAKIEESPTGTTRFSNSKASNFKQTLRFVKFKRKPSRLSEIIYSQDTDSVSSGDSLLDQPPFKRSKPN